MATLDSPFAVTTEPNAVLVSPVGEGDQRIFWVRFPDRETQDAFTSYLVWKDIVTVDSDVLPEFITFACRQNIPVCFEAL